MLSITGNDFNTFITEGVLGFYNRCEVTEIFLFNRQTKKAYNYYTLAVFEEANLPTKRIEQLTNKLVQINSDWSLGIVRHYEAIREMEQYYLRLIKDNKWVFNHKELILSKLVPVPKQFIPPDGTIDTPLNLILKNNFVNGSYLLEFFDEEKKSYIHSLSLNERNKINEHIKSILPIDLGFISERVGNIIYQFPVTLMRVEHNGLSEQNSIEIKLAWHPNLIGPLSHRIHVYSELDETITGFKSIDGNNAGVYRIELGNSSSKHRITVFNPNSELILYSYHGSFIEKIGLQMNIDLGIEPRNITISDKTETIELNYMQQHWIGLDENNYINYIEKRLEDNEKKVLERRGVISQYCKFGDKEREKALYDIRKLVQTYGKEEIYLWDPFLTYKDIFNTLYFSTIYGIKLKAIGSFTEFTKKVITDNIEAETTVDFPIWRDEQMEGFKNSSNNIGINLEFRSKHGTHGWDFHDRFLIFPASRGYETPRVWSLGSSINGLGNRHHIVQEVPHARIIIEAFEQLWEALSDSDCLVWRIQ